MVLLRQPENACRCMQQEAKSRAAQIGRAVIKQGPINKSAQRPAGVGCRQIKYQTWHCRPYATCSAVLNGIRATNWIQLAGSSAKPQ
jgi:hypothetical protein